MAKKLSRRDFLKSSASAGLGVALAGKTLTRDASAFTRPQAGVLSDLKVAVIGTGSQGRVLIDSLLRIPGVRISALCDIWEYSQQYARNYLKKYGYVVNVYEDYRDLLDKEKDLDAAIVATPDWVHAEQTKACLEAGLHVYCEKEMSNSLAEARTMVQAARRTGKLLQIGHQRRSNPRYIQALDRLIHEKRLLGRIFLAYAQWHRARDEMLGWPKRYTLDPAILKKYGYGSMRELRNWRWFRKYGGGPVVDLGSHQIDLFSWAFRTNPSSVAASGGRDYYQDREWYDNVMAIFEFETQQGKARAFCQVQTATSHGGFYETFMGDEGSLVISEMPQKGNWAIREAHAPEWDSLIKEGLLKSEVPAVKKSEGKDIFLDVRATAELGRWYLPLELAKPPHQPHLENFFQAVREGIPLACPAEAGYASAAVVLSVNEAVESGQLFSFRPEMFKA